MNSVCNSSIVPPLPENVLSLNMSQRAWNGVHLSVAAYSCNGEVLHKLPQEDRARLSVVLEEVGGACEPRLHANSPCPIAHAPRHILYAPAGMEVWGYTKDARHIVDATLAFDFAMFSERLAMPIDPSLSGNPQLRFVNARIAALVELLAQAIGNPDPSMQLYGDGITVAIASQLFVTQNTPVAYTGMLAPWQLRRVVDYMENHLPQRVELATLAGLINLSQAHFSRAFKASTGLAPYQWQLDARIRRAQISLVHSEASISEVALATGFSDTVHFARTFRKLVGITPGVWRRERKR
ncbi:AraC family transcriptional regulator [Oxalobacteraceae bacterium OTU3CINTB1]|nr:AraC family transcriptional regulator [Oxalobacteraceae bacterium OTU3CINTB1]